MLLVVVIGVAIFAGLTAWYYVPLFPGEARDVSIGRAEYAIDPGNDRESAGFASDIFFGRVMKKSGQTMENGFPETHYQVEVLEVLKGSVSGTVKVSQEAGVVENGAMFFMEGDTKLLETGKTYLLVTKGSATKESGGGYVILSGGYGHHVLPGVASTAPVGPVGSTGDSDSGEAPPSPGRIRPAGPGGQHRLGRNPEHRARQRAANPLHPRHRERNSLRSRQPRGRRG